MIYSIQERVEIVKLYYQNGSIARATARLFNALHQDKNINDKYVAKLIRKFEETGSVSNIRRNRNQENRPVRNEAAEIAVLGHVALDNTQSTRGLATSSGFTRSTVQRILKHNKFHPYKIKLVHELHEDDFDRRLEFCELMSHRLINNANLLFNICFSDECTFYLHGAVNRHNCRYWSDSNPHLFREVHSQYPEKINVWAGIFGNHIVGPFFIAGNLRGDMYLDMLENTIEPRITEIIENDVNYSENDIHFQQDGAPPHYVAPVRQFLDTHFPNQWIGRRGPIEWPPRSPDLSPLDYFLWGHLKSKVFSTKPNSIQDLQERITTECRKITADILENVRNRFEQNLYYCMEVNGHHFQHLLPH